MAGNDSFGARLATDFTVVAADSAALVAASLTVLMWLFMTAPLLFLLLGFRLERLHISAAGWCVDAQ